MRLYELQIIVPLRVFNIPPPFIDKYEGILSLYNYLYLADNSGDKGLYPYNSAKSASIFKVFTVF